MVTIIVFLLVLGILIFVHELGHFLTAIKSGIRAEEFGFGFPPRIFGIQKISGKNLEKVSAKDEIKIETEDYLEGDVEVIKEKITETIQEVDQITPVKKWRWIWGNYDGDSPEEIEDHKEKSQPGFSSGTIYSLNWIPLGGFVRIKGENGDKKNEPDSFAAKGAWTRIMVLAAGVIMNFVLAWVLIALAFMVGTPKETIDLVRGNNLIKIADVNANSPAYISGLKSGDEIINQQGKTNFMGTADFINYINANKGKEVQLKIKRDGTILSVKLTPRTEYPENQGPIGITFDSGGVEKLPWYQAIWLGLVAVGKVIYLMLATLYSLIMSPFSGQKVAAEVTGPVGIILLTKQAFELGFVPLILFMALISINLGIINILPIPALDGGRILFILIEKIKGSPVSQKTEQMFHTIGFVILITLMVWITFKDVAKFIIK